MRCHDCKHWEPPSKDACRGWCDAFEIENDFSADSDYCTECFMPHMYCEGHYEMCESCGKYCGEYHEGEDWIEGLTINVSPVLFHHCDACLGEDIRG